MKTITVCSLDILDDRQRQAFVKRFWALVDRAPSGCWTWNGIKHASGYGQVYLAMIARKKVSLRAHRAAYMIVRGEIPDGLVIDHLCRNVSCVNPGHLEAVSQRENTYRGRAPAILTMHAGVCARGHERVEGDPFCRACHRLTSRKYHARNITVVKEKARLWRLENLEKKRAMDRAWNERNAERKRAYNKDRQEKIRAGTWQPYEDEAGSQAVTLCEDCDVTAGTL